MHKTRTVKVMLLAALILTLTFIQFAVAGEHQMEDTQMFFEFQWPGIQIRVNATSKALPEESMTIILLVKSTLEIDVKYLDLKVFGFTEGQDKTLLGSMSDDDGFSLTSNKIEEFSDTFPIPEHVWGVTYGELSFEYESEGYPYPALSFGFTLTYVKNIKLERLEEDFQSLTENFTELQQNFTRLEGNHTKLKANYTDLEGKYDELSKSVAGFGNMRHTMIIFAITTAVFVATTIYLFIRKTKRSSQPPTSPISCHRARSI